MKKLNPDQAYFVEEFYEDYREGSMTRREFVKRIAFITGSMAATIATMGAVGCTESELPAPTDPMPTPVPPTTTAVAAPIQAELIPVPNAQSPFTVPEGDPALQTSLVTFTSQGDEIFAYLARPVEEGVYPAILVCHENRGLTEHIKDVTRRFGKEGYVALAIDLLAREGGTAVNDSSQIPGLLGNAGSGRHTADFTAGFNYLNGQAFVENGRIGMTGYCFGGGVTWDTAAALPELKAVAPFYGRGPDLAQVPNIQAAVLGVYAEQDSRINAGIPDLEEALMQANKTYQINIYPGVNHAFHNDTGARYIEEQATQAWLDTLAWFETYV